MKFCNYFFAIEQQVSAMMWCWKGVTAFVSQELEITQTNIEFLCNRMHSFNAYELYLSGSNEPSSWMQSLILYRRRFSTNNITNASSTAHISQVRQPVPRSTGGTLKWVSVWCQTYGYLPSHRASPPVGQYRTNLYCLVTEADDVYMPSSMETGKHIHECNLLTVNNNNNSPISIAL